MRYSKEFKQKSLKGDLPVLETPEFCISDTLSILRWVARTHNRSLYGNTL